MSNIAYYTRCPHLLRPPDGDEAADPGLRAPLGQTSDEEAALGEAHRVVTVCGGHCHTSTVSSVELETKVHTKVRNHGESPF